MNRTLRYAPGLIARVLEGKRPLDVVSRWVETAKPIGEPARPMRRGRREGAIGMVSPGVMVTGGQVLPDIDLHAITDIDDAAEAAQAAQDGTVADYTNAYGTPGAPHFDPQAPPIDLELSDLAAVMLGDDTLLNASHGQVHGEDPLDDPAQRRMAIRPNEGRRGSRGGSRNRNEGSASKGQTIVDTVTGETAVVTSTDDTHITLRYDDNSIMCHGDGVISKV